MSDKGDRNSEEWCPGESDGDGRRRLPDESLKDVDEKTELTREEWERLSADPDWGENLGYEVMEWEQFETLDGSDASMFLPADEAVLREDAFVVAADEDIVDLGKWY